VNPAERTAWVVGEARALGFDLCGVAPAEGWEELTHLEEWLARGYAGEMRYLDDPRRRSPAAAMAGARCVIVCAVNYNTALPYSVQAVGAQHAAPVEGAPHGWISRYAWGDDYHEVVGAKLRALTEKLRESFGADFQARAYVDTGPLVERLAAKYAGLGWLAKNTCLINEQLGSWLFLGVILTTLELEPSLAPGEAPPADLCGNCRLCIDACPTGAIVEPYLLDARRCISYLTIELRGSIPEELRASLGRHVFGCDICQDLCPWNRRSPVTREPRFLPRSIETRNSKLETRNLPLGTQGTPHVAAAFRPAQVAQDESNSEGTSDPREQSTFAPSLEWLASLTENDFREFFRGSALQRAKWRGLVRNACLALGNSVSFTSSTSSISSTSSTSFKPRILFLLERLAASDDSLIAHAAQWALGRFTAQQA